VHGEPWCAKKSWFTGSSAKFSVVNNYISRLDGLIIRRYLWGDFMKNIRRTGAILLFILCCFSQSKAFAVDTRFTWMLPKTVIDATVVYTFQSCEKGSPKIKITPTLVARTLPDPLVGQKQLPTDVLESVWEDRNISLQTFAGSRILNSIGSAPTSQVAQAAGNVLGGIAKIVGIFLGAATTTSTAVNDTTPPPVNPVCANDPNLKSAQSIAQKISDLKDSITTLQMNLALGVDDATQKKDTATIQAAQALITILQDKLTITIKTTIDPSVGPIQPDPDNDAPSSTIPTASDVVPESGLISTICPSKNQLGKENWFSNLDQIFNGGDKPKTACLSLFPFLTVDVYLDFKNAHSTMFDPDHSGVYTQTSVSADSQYRDVAYIPVEVWRGEKQADTIALTQDGALIGNALLAPPQFMPFGQFGVAQSLPFNAPNFKSLTWQITFLEDGEITAATFASKATAVSATALFGNAASTASSIAANVSAAGSPSTQATALEAQADLIYQTQRLQLCQTNPVSCPSK
jgi:hypothetical protein